MPELPEVETIRRGLSRKLVNKPKVEAVIFCSTHRNIYETPRRRLKETLPGRVLYRINRAGKNLLFDLGSHLTLTIHLGMTGKLLLHEQTSPLPLPKHTHLKIRFSNGCEVHYVDPRRFGRVKLYHQPAGTVAKKLRLGPDALEDNIKWEELKTSLGRHRKDIKSTLLLPQVVSGLGNIYASEILYEARIDPRRPANTLSDEEIQSLLHNIKKVIKQAVQNRGTTFSDYRDEKNVRGGFKPRIYGREGLPCEACGKKIEKIVQGGRSTFYCPRCQR